MQVDITINNSNATAARHLTWGPSPLRLRLIDPPARS
jgi:tyrosinase